MKDQILYKTLGYLRDRAAGQHLQELHLTPYFTTAGLADGSASACMSYYRIPDEMLVEAEDILKDVLADDLSQLSDRAFLVRQLSCCVPEEEQLQLLITSVTATIISAISAPLLGGSGDQFFRRRESLPLGWSTGAQTALVVGFGGMLRSLLRQSHIKEIHSIDLYYSPESETYQRAISALEKEHPECRLTFSTGLERKDDFKRFDVLAITGSTLCNSTLEGLLAHARGDAVVIMQGQSASIHPRYLFESGVSFVATTLKPTLINRLAEHDRTGEAMRGLLDGGLPQIFLEAAAQVVPSQGEAFSF